MQIRKRHSSKFKAKVALEAIKERKTAAVIASDNGVHSTLVSQWKRQLSDGASKLFESQTSKKSGNNQGGFSQEELLSQIGKLKVELDWLKKKL